MIYMVSILTIDPTTLQPDDRGLEYWTEADDKDAVMAYAMRLAPAYSTVSVSY